MKHPARNIVAFVQPFVPSYRKGLFDALARELESHGLGLEVWHDQPKGIVAARRNSISGTWSIPTRQHRLSIGRRNITFRNVNRRARGVQAVVAGLASTNLETYLLALDKRVTLMLWGHGRNFTGGNTTADARLERWLSNRATRIFTYTDSGAEHLVEAGVDRDKVSIVLNSTDTKLLREHQSTLPAGYLADTRRELRLEGKKVALFVGAFDEPKRLPFLFDAADRVYAELPGFVLMLAGAGPLDAFVEEQARSRPYVRLLGRLELAELARLSNVVDVLVMPGRVGLVAVDSLALGVPLVTTRYPFHAPEAEYLTPENSIWTDDDPERYADAIVTLLGDEGALRSLRERTRSSGDEFSVQQSARIFVDGLLRGLAVPGSTIPA